MLIRGRGGLFSRSPVEGYGEDGSSFDDASLTVDDDLIPDLIFSQVGKSVRGGSVYGDGGVFVSGHER